MTESKLEAALYSNRGTKQGHRRHAEGRQYGLISPANSVVGHTYE